MITDDEIIEVAKQVWGVLSAIDYPEHHTEFARLIIEKQKDIDACMADNFGPPGYAKDLADEIRRQK